MRHSHTSWNKNLDTKMPMTFVDQTMDQTYLAKLDVNRKNVHLWKIEM